VLPLVPACAVRNRVACWRSPRRCAASGSTPCRCMTLSWNSSAAPAPPCRRQHLRPQILRIALPLPPTHRVTRRACGQGQRTNFISPRIRFQRSQPIRRCSDPGHGPDGCGPPHPDRSHRYTLSVASVVENYFPDLCRAPRNYLCYLVTAGLMPRSARGRKRA
jgi:hypothetical protein